MPREQLIVRVLEYVEKMTQASEEQTGQRAASNSLRTKLLGEIFYQKFLQPRAIRKSSPLCEDLHQLQDDALSIYHQYEGWRGD